MADKRYPSSYTGIVQEIQFALRHLLDMMDLHSGKVEPMEGAEPVTPESDPQQFRALEIGHLLSSMSRLGNAVAHVRERLVTLRGEAQEEAAMSTKAAEELARESKPCRIEHVNTAAGPLWWCMPHGRIWGEAAENPTAPCASWVPPHPYPGRGMGVQPDHDNGH